MITLGRFYAMAGRDRDHLPYLEAGRAELMMRADDGTRLALVNGRSPVVRLTWGWLAGLFVRRHLCGVNVIMWWLWIEITPWFARKGDEYV